MIADTETRVTRLPKTFIAAVAAITVLGIALRIPHLSGYSGMTGDEAFSLALTQRPFVRMLRLFQFEANGLLYPLTLYVFARTNNALWVLRAPAVVAGVLLVGATIWTGLAITNRRAALLAGLFVAVSPLAIADSQLARPYIFAALFTTIAVGMLIRAAHTKASRTYWVGFVLAMTAAAYSNSLAIALIAIPQVAVLVGASPQVRRQTLAAVAALGALIAPLAVLLAVEHSRRNPLYWLHRPTLQNARDAVYNLSVNKVGVLIALAVLVAGCVADERLGNLIRPRAWKNMRSEKLEILLIWSTLPLAALFVVSQLVPLFYVGYMLPLEPGMMLLLAALTVQLPRSAAALAAAAYVTISLLAFFTSPGSYHPTGWNAAAQELRHDPAGDSFVFDIPDSLTLAGYYDKRFAGPNGWLIVNEWRDAPLPSNVTLYDDPGGYGKAPAGPPERSVLQRLLAKSQRDVIIVTYEMAGQALLRRWPALRRLPVTCRVHTGAYGPAQIARVSCLPPHGGALTPSKG